MKNNTTPLTILTKTSLAKFKSDVLSNNNLDLDVVGILGILECENKEDINKIIKKYMPKKEDQNDYKIRANFYDVDKKCITLDFKSEREAFNYFAKLRNRLITYFFYEYGTDKLIKQGDRGDIFPFQPIRGTIIKYENKEDMHLDEALENLEKQDNFVQTTTWDETLKDPSRANSIYRAMKDMPTGNTPTTTEGLFNNLPKEDRVGKKESQVVEKAPIFTYCKQMKNAIEALALRSLHGHKKYEVGDDWENFARVKNGEFEYANASFRHALGIGDDENDLEHEIASVWNAIAKLEIKLRKLK